MIQDKSYTKEWIEAKVKEYDANSYDLAEKMTYALSLLEQLSFKGLDFIFKGGTSLVLMFEHFHRFSKDIDILIPVKPNNLTDIFDKIIEDTLFTKWEKSERQSDEFQVPKEHYKFYYKLSKPSKYAEQPVLLDIIYVENTYPETTQVTVNHHSLNTDIPFTTVTIPTFNSITGDKLTAFAPTTIGIPYGKGKAVEIAKQLYDLNLLIDSITDIKIVAESFEKTATMVIHHYKKDISVNEVYQDIIDTAFCMAMMENKNPNPELYKEIKSGVTSLSQYLGKKTNFTYNKAITASAKVAYLATCLMKGKEPKNVIWNTTTQLEFKNTTIGHPEYSKLNKALKASYSEAWYYWYCITFHI